MQATVKCANDCSRDKMCQPKWVPAIGRMPNFARIPGTVGLFLGRTRSKPHDSCPGQRSSIGRWRNTITIQRAPSPDCPQPRSGACLFPGLLGGDVVSYRPNCKVPASCVVVADTWPSSTACDCDVTGLGAKVGRHVVSRRHRRKNMKTSWPWPS